MALAAPTQARTNVTLSTALQNVPLRTALVDLSKRYRESVSLPDDVRGFVTVSLRNLSFEEALRAVLTPLGYRFMKTHNVYYISKAPADRTTPPLGGPGQPAPAVLPVTLIDVQRAANLLHGLFPQATIHTDRSAGALLVIATAEDLQSMRAVLQGIDVRDPGKLSPEVISLRTAEPAKIQAQLRSLYPNAQITTGPNHTLIVKSTASDLAQVKALVTAIDVPSATPVPLSNSAEAVHLSEARPRDVARAVAARFPRVRAAVAGATIVVSGSADDVSKAKALIAQLDAPAYGARITQVYRIRTLDAASVGDLIARSFLNTQVTVDKNLNALSVTATFSAQQRIADSIKQLDGPPETSAGGVPPSGGGNVGSGSIEIVTLRSAVPTQGQAGGSVDITSSFVQALQQLVPGVRATPLLTPGQIALIGDPASVRLAKEVIAKLDVPAALVVLDTEVLEIDESVARNLGLLLSPPVLSTTFSEVLPPTDVNGGRVIGLQALTRTPLAFGAQLNLQIQKGNARVLADPRITTLSGHTATIRAGDTINILTTTGGGTGTIATTQLQSFQTGVTLDITPLVTSDSDVTVALHPVVNSLTGILNGVPQIATRDTQTVVHLKNNETLVIGGLIQESSQRTENKIPLLGDIPLLGRLFRNNEATSTRNELIIVVTPHLIVDGETPLTARPVLPTIPTPRPLPTLPPGTKLPQPRLDRLTSRATPTPRRTPIEVGAGPAPVFAASASPSSSGTPVPVPTSFPTTLSPPLPNGNIFAYGQKPTSNLAQPNDAVQIFYATLSPTTVANAVNVAVSATTTTNATKVALAYGTSTVSLGQVAPGQWQATFPFQTTALPPSQRQTIFSLTATRIDGSAIAITIPATVLP